MQLILFSDYGFGGNTGLYFGSLNFDFGGNVSVDVDTPKAQPEILTLTLQCKRYNVFTQANKYRQTTQHEHGVID
jgi:hypothetical protein